MTLCPRARGARAHAALVRARARVHGSGTWTGKNLILDETLPHMVTTISALGDLGGPTDWIHVLHKNIPVLYSVQL